MKTFYKLIILLLFGSVYAQDNIASIEYFIDVDPGVGAATNVDIDPNVEIIDQNFSIPTTGLSQGTHRLFIRAIKDDGNIGFFESKTFRISPTLENNSTDIVEAEYFFDTDPGIGNGTVFNLTDAASIDETLSLDTSALSVGTHRLFVRVKNNDDTYSIYEHKTFRISPVLDNNSADIVEAEYFFDTDPGVGNGTVFDLTDATSIDETLSLDTSGLSEGTHRLFVRVKNEDDTYSIYEHKTFRISPVLDNNSADIVEAEYFFDTDPGVGNGTVFDLTDAASIDETLSLNTSGLSAGTHRLFVRVKNDDDTYSIYEHKTFRVGPVLDNNSATIVAAEYFIDVDPGIGNATAITVSGDDIDENLMLATSTGLNDGTHFLYVRTLNADGEWSLYAPKEFEVDGTTLGSENLLLDAVKIYPNPVVEKLTINLPNTAVLESINIYDITGKQIFTGRNSEINMTNMSSGTYLVILKTDIGTISKKIIKQ